MADISTDYLTQTDIDKMFELSDGRCPFRIMRHEGGFGFLFSIIRTGNRQEDLLHIGSGLKAAGFSDRMVGIFQELRRQLYDFVRVDVDGCDIQNVEKIHEGFKT